MKILVIVSLAIIGCLFVYAATKTFVLLIKNKFKRNGK